MSIQRIDVTWNASDVSNCFGFKPALEQLGFNMFSNNGSNVCYFGHTGDDKYFNMVIMANGNHLIRIDSTEMKNIGQYSTYRILYEKNSTSGDVLFGVDSTTSSNISLTLVALSATYVLNNQDCYIYGRTTSSTQLQLYPSKGSASTYAFNPSSRATSDYIKTLTPIAVGDCVAKKSYFSYYYRQGEDTANYTEFTMNDKNYCSSAYGSIIIEL